MRTLQVSAIALVAMLAFGSFARAEDVKEQPKEVTLQGQMMCGHCVLKEGEKCHNVLMVKDGDKEVRYDVVLGADTKDSHVCKGKQEVKVTGTVTQKEGEKVLTATKVEKVEAAKVG